MSERRYLALIVSGAVLLAVAAAGATVAVLARVYPADVPPALPGASPVPQLPRGWVIE